MIENEQRLLAEILDLFAQKFSDRAVLRGGMVLCLLGSPRLTNDLDYVFVPYKSKKDIVDEIINALNTIVGVSLKHSINSKCLRVLVTRAGITVQVEAKVAIKVRTATASTRLFSPKYRFPPRLIHVADYSVALANKMAAWNERRLIRDVYDISFYRQMSISPDTETLMTRLSKPSYSKLVKEDDYFTGKTEKDFYNFLREKTNTLSDKDIVNEMSDYLAPEEIHGLAMEIRASLAKL
ncbi:MAG: nucleotidyl transferase AbiEii/AbiGii toxin family protein [Planctomycetes bacterium]|nr:nucleotidyl transferase AbiEii/AbiGii toxin family protein [Planctomycetota bacterium]